MPTAMNSEPPAKISNPIRVTIHSGIPLLTAMAPREAATTARAAAIESTSRTSSSRHSGTTVRSAEPTFASLDKRHLFVKTNARTDTPNSHEQS